MDGIATGLDGAACTALIARLLPKWKRDLRAAGIDEGESGIDMRYTVADALEDLHVLELATLEAHAQARAAKAEGAQP